MEALPLPKQIETVTTLLSIKVIPMHNSKLLLKEEMSSIPQVRLSRILLLIIPSLIEMSEKEVLY